MDWLPCMATCRCQARPLGELRAMCFLLLSLPPLLFSHNLVYKVVTVFDCGRYQVWDLFLNTL